MKFIYALCEEDRKLLLAKGSEELFTCKINGKQSYAFDNSKPDAYATFSKEDKKKFFISDVAMYI